MELTNEQKKQIEQLQQDNNKDVISGYLAIITATVPLVIWPFFPQRFFFPKILSFILGIYKKNW